MIKIYNYTIKLRYENITNTIHKNTIRLLVSRGSIYTIESLSIDTLSYLFIY